MKKIFSIILVLILMASALVGCTEEGAMGEVATGDLGIVKIGLGTAKTSIAKTKNATDDKGPTAQVDTTYAAVAFDKDGKVVKVTIDHAQTAVAHDKDLNIAGNIDLRTKVEKGPDYGMIKASAIGKEWFEQIAALEDWMIGKTVKEITGLKTYEKDASHLFVPDVPELTSSVTVTVEGYLAAVENAYKNAVKVEKGAVELGLGADVQAKSTKSDKGVTVQVNNTITAAAFDKNGKTVGVIMDVAQTSVPFDTEGKLTVDPAEFTANYRTKVEKGPDYGMIKASPIGKEWFEQAAALEDWMVGKTAKEITGLKTYEKDASHLAVPDVPELTSSVTMTVEGFLASLGNAYKNAK